MAYFCKDILLMQIITDRGKITKKVLILKEVPKIADKDFMGANKTRMVISESAMVKKAAAFELVQVKPSVIEVGISGSDID